MMKALLSPDTQKIAFRRLALSIALLWISTLLTYGQSTQVSTVELMKTQSGLQPTAKDQRLFDKMDQIVQAHQVEDHRNQYEDWTPKAAERIGGVMVVNSFTLPPNSRVEVKEDLYLYAKGDVIIDGDLIARAQQAHHPEGINIMIRSDKRIIVHGQLIAGNGAAGASLAKPGEVRVEGGRGGSLILDARILEIDHDLSAGNGGDGYKGGNGGAGGSLYALNGVIDMTRKKVAFFGGNGGHGGDAPKVLPDHVKGIPGGNGGEGGCAGKATLRNAEVKGPGSNGAQGTHDMAYTGIYGLDGGNCEPGGKGGRGNDAHGGDGGNGGDGFGINGWGGIGGNGGHAFAGWGGKGGDAGDCCTNPYGPGWKGGNGGDGGDAFGGNGGNGGNGDDIFFGPAPHGGDGGRAGNGVAGSGGDGGNGGNGYSQGQGGTGGDPGSAVAGNPGLGGLGGISQMGPNGAHGSPGIGGAVFAGAVGDDGGKGVVCVMPTVVRVLADRYASRDNNRFDILNLTTEDYECEAVEVPNELESYYYYSLDHGDCYRFIIHDDAGDGFAGGGSYSIQFRGDVVATSNFVPNGRDPLYSENQEFGGSCTGNKKETSDLTEPVFSIAPNPAHTQTKVLFDRVMEGTTELILRDMTGKVIHSFSGEQTDCFPIGLSQLPKGIYLLTVRNGDWVQSKKIVKQ